MKPPGAAGTSAAGTGGTAGAGGTSGSGGGREAGTSAGASGSVGTAASGSGADGSAGSDDAGDDGSAGGSAGVAGTSGLGGSGATVADGGLGAGGDASGKGGTGGLVGSGGSGGVTALPLNGMVLWLTATQGVVRSGAGVSRWEDQSAFGNHATQNGPSAQPTLGGHWRLPTVDFDGDDDFFVLPASATFSDFSGGFSAFFAVESHGGGPCQSLIQFSNGAGVDEILLHRETAGDFVYQAPGGLARCRGNMMPVDEPVLAAVVHEGDVVSLFIDAVYCGGGAVGPLTNVVKNSATIGRAAHPSCARFSGHMGEIIVYNRALDMHERMAAERHLQIRWDL